MSETMACGACAASASASRTSPTHRQAVTRSPRSAMWATIAERRSSSASMSRISRPRCSSCSASQATPRVGRKQHPPHPPSAFAKRVVQAGTALASVAYRTKPMRPSSIQELEVLPDEVAADVLGIGVDQLPGDRPWCLARADGGAVEAFHWQDAEAGRGEEHLVGVGGVKQVDVAGGARDAK